LLVRTKDPLTRVCKCCSRINRATFFKLTRLPYLSAIPPAPAGCRSAGGV
jgi:hypothetical protein